MKITNTNANMLNTAYTNKTPAKLSSLPSGGYKKAENMDSVNISSSVKDRQTILSSMETQPEDRAAKVERLKLSVANGHYNINANNVAEKMTSYFLDNFA